MGFGRIHHRLDSPCRSAGHRRDHRRRQQRYPGAHVHRRHARAHPEGLRTTSDSPSRSRGDRRQGRHAGGLACPGESCDSRIDAPDSAGWVNLSSPQREQISRRTCRLLRARLGSLSRRDPHHQRLWVGTFQPRENGLPRLAALTPLHRLFTTLRRRRNRWLLRDVEHFFLK